MKTRQRLFLILMVGALLLVAAGAAHAQTPVFDLSWWSVDSGGGISSGGGLILQGAIGQFDAGQMTGGGLVLRGGFWNPRPVAFVGTSIFLPITLK